MICFIDFETTGIDVFKDRAIEIGAVLVNENAEVMNEFHSYINPNFKRKFKASAKEKHGYANMEQLKNEPLEDDVLESFFNKMGTSYCFCSWNISFDITFFRRMCHRNNRMKEFNSINYRHLDMQSITQYHNYLNNINIEINSLDNNLSNMNILRSETHSAIEDARLLLDVYRNLYNK